MRKGDAPALRTEYVECNALRQGVKQALGAGRVYGEGLMDDDSLPSAPG